jgi:hypothetical protein
LRLALGSLAYCPEYDCEKAIFEFIHTPQPFTVDAEAEARAVGCKWEYEWLQDKITSLSLDHCWCAALQADCMPEASNEEIKAFLFKILHKDEYLFITKKHHGELFRHTCSLCGATVLELLVECEGYGDSIHSYFTFPTSAELEDLSAGILGPKNYEQFVEQRCGIHKDGFDGMFYKRIKVGYIGLDSLEA